MERTSSLVGDGVLRRDGSAIAAADSVPTLCTLWALRVTVAGWCGMGTHTAGFSSMEAAPNKRLKLTGGDRFSGIGVLCPWRDTDFVQHPCAGGRVARSLSAIR